MDQMEIIITIAGASITTLIGAVGYLLNRQLQRVDDKVTTMDNQFFEMKSKVLEIARVDKSAIIDHLNHEIMPMLKSRKLDDAIHGVRADITVLKEYQRNKISPTLERVIIMSDKMDEQAKKQTESDFVLLKMFEVVKKTCREKRTKMITYANTKHMTKPQIDSIMTRVQEVLEYYIRQGWCIVYAEKATARHAAVSIAIVKEVAARRPVRDLYKLMKIKR